MLYHKILFSKDRPLQLDLVLKSLYLNCEEKDTKTSCIYKVSTEYVSSYAKLKEEWPQVNFVEQTNFKSQFEKLVGESKYTLLAVDDSIFIEPFKMGDIEKIDDDILGISYRLGMNCTYCYPAYRSQFLPKIDKTIGELLVCNWAKSDGDFGYPFEVSSSIYRSSDILDAAQTFNNFEINNPNDLEYVLSIYSQYFFLKTGKKLDLAFYKKSKAFSVPLNKVQNVAVLNRAGNKDKYTPASLLKMYNSGIRLDAEKWKGFTPNACHMEVEIL